MATLRIPTAPVFRPLLEPARYKGAYGDRGSGKSHFFGELMVERCLVNPGTLAVCIREVQKSLLQSPKRLIESKIQSLGVGAHFQVLHDRIVTPGDGLIIFQGMQDSTAESIKMPNESFTSEKAISSLCLPVYSRSKAVRARKTRSPSESSAIDAG